MCDEGFVGVEHQQASASSAQFTTFEFVKNTILDNVSHKKPAPFDATLLNIETTV